MNNRDQQEREELTVFREFANVCPLALLANTARNGPNPPDILCDLDAGETLAFELKEIVDEQAIKKHAGVQRLQMSLKSEYKKAIERGDIEQPERFNYHAIWVRFYSKGSRQNAVRRVIELLNELGPGHHAIDEPPIRSIRCEHYQHPCSYAGPEFYVSPFSIVGEFTVAAIQEKLGKPYQSEHKIHLVAWSETAAVAESQFWWGDLLALLQSKGMGPFERIWVFGFGAKSIVFDSADVVEVGAVR